MTRYEIEQGLNALYRDLDNVQNMDEEIRPYKLRNSPQSLQCRLQG